MDHEKKLRTLLLTALNQSVSDLHFTKSHSGIIVEHRSLTGSIEIQKQNLSTSFFEYLKYRARMDLLNLAKPQSTQFSITIQDLRIDIRCAYVKSRSIETLVLRILNPPYLLTLNQLVLDPNLRKTLTDDLKRNAGLLLFSGSTGSGKTTSLYTCLDWIKNSKIYSVEDPIERIRDHIVQLEVNERLNFGFEEAIKQILRHDPNIIVIGEIRSPKEAQAALRCALSGHLVVSTIHANSAYLTLQRLNDFEIPRELIDDVLVAIYYQNLEYSEKQGKRFAHFSRYPSISTSL